MHAPDVGRGTLTFDPSSLLLFFCYCPFSQYVLHYSWLKDSLAAGSFLSESAYLLADPESEAKYHFRLAERNPDTRCLSGYSFFVTPGVKPPPAAMNAIIQSAGGKVGHGQPAGARTA